MIRQSPVITFLLAREETQIAHTVNFMPAITLLKLVEERAFNMQLDRCNQLFVAFYFSLNSFSFHDHCSPEVQRVTDYSILNILKLLRDLRTGTAETSLYSLLIIMILIHG